MAGAFREREATGGAFVAQPEARSYSPSPYERWIYGATDALEWLRDKVPYGDAMIPEDGMRRREMAEKYLGASNPFNLPFQALHGAEALVAGARDGDPYGMAAGALEVGGAGLGLKGVTRAAKGQPYIDKMERAGKFRAANNQRNANAQLKRNINREFHQDYANLPEEMRQAEIARRVAQDRARRAIEDYSAKVEIGPAGSFQGEMPPVGWWNDVDANFASTKGVDEVPSGHVWKPRFGEQQPYHPADPLPGQSRDMFDYEIDPLSVPAGRAVVAPSGTPIGSLRATLEPASPNRPPELPAPSEPPRQSEPAGSMPSEPPSPASSPDDISVAPGSVEGRPVGAFVETPSGTPESITPENGPDLGVPTRTADDYIMPGPRKPEDFIRAKPRMTQLDRNASAADIFNAISIEPSLLADMRVAYGSKPMPRGREAQQIRRRVKSVMGDAPRTVVDNVIKAFGETPDNPDAIRAVSRAMQNQARETGKGGKPIVKYAVPATAAAGAAMAPTDRAEANPKAMEVRGVIESLFDEAGEVEAILGEADQDHGKVASELSRQTGLSISPERVQQVASSVRKLGRVPSKEDWSMIWGGRDPIRSKQAFAQPRDGAGNFRPMTTREKRQFKRALNMQGK